MLYVFFWVIPRRLISNSRRFGTLYQFHLHRHVDEVDPPAYEDGTERVPKRQLLELRRRGITQNKTYYKLTVVYIDLLKPTAHVMHQQFNIQQQYALPTLYLCVLYLSENKQRLVPLTA